MNTSTENRVADKPMRWALEYQGLTTSEKITLIAVAYHANAEGAGAWPGNKRLQEVTALGERTIQRALRSLEEKGLIIPTRTNKPTQREYLINYRKLKPRGATVAGGATVTGAPQWRGEGATVAPEQSNEQSKRDSTRTRANALDGFEEWWKAYPRGEEKKAAREVWKRKKLAKHQDAIMADTQARVARGEDPKYLPYGRRYLSNEKWKDEPNQENRNDQPKTERGLSAPERVRRATADWLERELNADGRSTTGPGGNIIEGNFTRNDDAGDQ